MAAYLTTVLRRCSAPIAALVLAVAGCGSGGGDGGETGGGPAPVCIPGASVACACSSGSAGAQICNSDGSGFDACSCTGYDGGRAGITSGNGGTDGGISSVCGNGVKESGESCDCGTDSTRFPSGCTGPNGLFNGDGTGCSKTCTKEPTCRSASGKTQACSTSCGNGNIEAGEDCDDGNQVSGDGCSSTCKVEDGFTWARYLFTFNGALALNFFSAEDMFVFINGILVIDLGGIHQRLPGQVQVDANGMATIIEGGSLNAAGTAILPCATTSMDPYTMVTFNNQTGTDGNGHSNCTSTTCDCRNRTVNLGLTVGNTYEIAIFGANRSPTESDFQLTVSGFSTNRSTCTRL